jgi:hypothetical protein
MTTQTADIKFLKRILFGLVAATLTAGTLAGVATVKAGPQTPNHSFFNYQPDFTQ